MRSFLNQVFICFIFLLFIQTADVWAKNNNQTLKADTIGKGSQSGIERTNKRKTNRESVFETQLGIKSAHHQAITILNT